MVGNFNTATFNNEQINQIENQQENVRLELYLNQMNLTDICRTIHPTIAEYTIFSRTYRTFFKIDHMIGHKSQQIEIIPSIFSDHNDMK